MRRRTIALTVGLALLFVTGAAMAQYQVTNLVGNTKGLGQYTDPLLINGWGLAYGPGSPFWLSDAGSGYSTLYNAGGIKQGLQVVVPSASGSGTGSPTGIVFNGSNDFLVQGFNSFFIFATLDGTISAWAPQVNLNQSIIMANNSASGAVYTGLAVTANASGNFLFAADVANNKVDMFDANFKLVNSFTDSTVAAGFAPFGIQDINGLLFVAFADQAGGPGGYVDIYSESGVFIKRLTQGAPLNHPWGFAAAPPNFGKLSNTLLVSNNVAAFGTINAYNALTGQLVGTIQDVNGKNIHIDQLWGIEFGGGSANNGPKSTLFFTAGPAQYSQGIFGKIVAVQ